jgi:4-hydroxy-3-methylbut-2-enyl diphosphate reductase
VRRAVALAESLARSGRRVFVDGELIHNGAVLRALLEKGIRTWDGLPRRWSPDDCLLIRAHGVSPERRKFLHGTGCAVHDATCPEVARSAARILRLRRKGYSILFYGDGNHPETAGLAAYAGDSMQVVRSVEDCRGFSGGHPVALLAQTTASGEDFQKLAEELAGLIPDLEVYRSICPSTLDRQQALRKGLTRPSIDLAVVVGSRHSANTRELVRIARASGKRVLPIEAADEIPPAVLENYRHALLASGASTPEESIAAVEHRLRQSQGGEAAGEERDASPMPLPAGWSCGLHGKDSRSAGQGI